MISTTSSNELTTLSRCRSPRRASSIMAAYNRRREMQDLLLLLLVLRRRQKRQNRRQLSYAGTPRSRPTRAASSSHSCIPCGRAHLVFGGLDTRHWLWHDNSKTKALIGQEDGWPAVYRRNIALEAIQRDTARVSRRNK